jgi:hypothetical protein
MKFTALFLIIAISVLGVAAPTNSANACVRPCGSVCCP